MEEKVNKHPKMEKKPEVSAPYDKTTTTEPSESTATSKQQRMIRPSHLQFADQLNPNNIPDFPLANAIHVENKIFFDRYQKANEENSKLENNRRDNKVKAEGDKIQTELLALSSLTDTIIEKTFLLKSLEKKAVQDYSFNEDQYISLVTTTIENTFAEVEKARQTITSSSKEELAKLESNLVKAESQIKAQMELFNKKSLSYDEITFKHRIDIEAKSQSEKRLLGLIQDTQRQLRDQLFKQKKEQDEYASEVRADLDLTNQEKLARFAKTIEEDEKELLRIRKKALIERENIQAEIRQSKDEINLLKKTLATRERNIQRIEEESRKRIEEAIEAEKASFNEQLKKTLDKEEEKSKKIKNLLFLQEEKDSYVRELESCIEMKHQGKILASTELAAALEKSNQRTNEAIKSEQIAFESIREKDTKGILKSVENETKKLLDQEGRDSKDRDLLLQEVSDLKSGLFKAQLKMIEDIKLTAFRDQCLSESELAAATSSLNGVEEALRESTHRVENALELAKATQMNRREELRENQQLHHERLQSCLKNKEDEEVRTLQEKLLKTEQTEYEVRVAQIKKVEEEESVRRLAQRLDNEKAEQENRKLAVLEQEEMEAQDRLVERLETEEREASERLSSMLEEEKQEAAERFARRIAEEEEQASNRCREKLEKEKNQAKARIEQRLQREKVEAESRISQALEAERKTAEERMKNRLEAEEKEAKTRIKRQLEKEAADAEQRKREMIEKENQAVKARQARILRSQLSAIENISVDIDVDEVKDED